MNGASPSVTPLRLRISDCAIVHPDVPTVVDDRTSTKRGHRFDDPAVLRNVERAVIVSDRSTATLCCIS
eukprot:1640129-Prymnesium_polylepis.1